ncbi:hypothetical protein B0H14DRAFT_2600734 [Mycena olivaceomarginata]|nr:hypothetical protein B0H14DRAFT_2600734 [Mycena olivaceomarginata]
MSMDKRRVHVGTQPFSPTRKQGVTVNAGQPSDVAELCRVSFSILVSTVQTLSELALSGVSQAKKGLDWGCEKVTGVKATPVQVACKGFELLALGGGRQTQDIMDSSYLSYKHKSFMDSGCLYFLGTGGGLLEKQAQELHILRLLVSLLDGGLLEKQAQELHILRLLFFTGRWITGKTSTGASRTQATCSLLDGGLLEKQAQELHILRLLVLLLDGGLLNGRLTGGGFTGAQDGSKASTCLCVQTF